MSPLAAAPFGREDLERERQDLGLAVAPRIDVLVADHSQRLPREDAGDDGVVGPGLDDALLRARIDCHLRGREEPCAAPSALTSEHERSGEGSPVAHAARCQHRYVDRVDNGCPQRERPDVTGVAARVAAGCHDAVDAGVDDALEPA